MASDSEDLGLRKGSNTTHPWVGRRKAGRLLHVVVIEWGADWRGWSEPSWRQAELMSLIQQVHESPREFAARLRATLQSADVLDRRTELAALVPSNELTGEIVAARRAIAAHESQPVAP